MTSLTISIDRTALDLDPLVLSGVDDANPLGITDYREPAMQSRIAFAPSSDYEPGDIPLAATWQQTVLAFAVAPRVSTEAEARALIAELVAAVSQGLTYLVTVTVDSAAPEVWTCNPGSVEPVGGRTFADLNKHDPEWAVSLPCHPIRA